MWAGNTRKSVLAVVSGSAAVLLVATTLTTAPFVATAAQAEQGGVDTQSAEQLNAALGVTVRDEPLEDHVAEPTDSEVPLVLAEIDESYTTSVEMSEAEGDAQLEALLGENAVANGGSPQALPDPADEVTAGIARIELNSDVVVFGVTWYSSEAVPERVEHRALIDGVWTEWAEAEAENLPGVSDTGGEGAVPRATEPVFATNADAIEVVVVGGNGTNIEEFDVRVVDPTGEAPVENSIEGSGETTVTEAPAGQPEDTHAEGAEPKLDDTEFGEPQVDDVEIADAEDDTAETELRDEVVGPQPSMAPVSFASSPQPADRLANVPVSANVNTGLGLVINSRQSWSPNEDWRRARGYLPGTTVTQWTNTRWVSPSTTYRGAVVHHTAGHNNYTQAQVPEVIRGVYYWNTHGVNFGDVAYQLVVDKYGGVWEGRYDSLKRSLVGAQAYGANLETFGISVLGTYDTAAPPAAAQESVAKAIAYMFKRYGITNPKGAIWIPHADGRGRTVPTILGHREATPTSCPGNAFFARMPYLRDRVVMYMNSGCPAFPDGKVPKDRYCDVPDSHQFVTHITWMASKGYAAQGPQNLKYHPGASTSRAAMATFLRRIYEPSYQPSPGLKLPYRDVTPSHKHYRGIAWLYERGYAVKADRFFPANETNRGAMATFLYRIEGGKGAASGAPPYNDVGASHPHARAITWMAKRGYAASGPSAPEYNPASSTSRGAMAAFLYRMNA